MFAVLSTQVEQELKAQADPEAWLALVHRLAEGVAKAGAPQLGHGVGERPDARQHHLRRPAHAIRVRRDLGRRSHGLDGLLDAPEIAHPVIDDRDHAPGLVGISRLPGINRTISNPESHP